jgi:hypothetical protein
MSLDSYILIMKLPGAITAESYFQMAPCVTHIKEHVTIAHACIILSVNAKKFLCWCISACTVFYARTFKSTHTRTMKYVAYIMKSQSKYGVQEGPSPVVNIKTNPTWTGCFSVSIVISFQKFCAFSIQNFCAFSYMFIIFQQQPSSILIPPDNA